MKKYLFVFMSVLLLVGMAGCSNDGNSDGTDDLEDNSTRIDSTTSESTKSNDTNLFLGKWKLESIEDGETISPYTGDNATVCFYEDGRFAYTPYVTKDSEGSVFKLHESSESVLEIKYSYTDEQLFIHLIVGGIKYVHSYSFSDDNKTLRVVLTKAEVEGNVCYIIPPSPGPMLGKTQVFKKVIADGTEITQYLAWEIVQDKVLNNKLDNIEVFVSKNTILPNTAIDNYYPEYAEQSPEFTSWLFFINDDPTANWTHPCRYVYVNVVGGEYEIHQNKMPPRFIDTDFIPLILFNNK